MRLKPLSARSPYRQFTSKWTRLLGLSATFGLLFPLCAQSQSVESLSDALGLGDLTLQIIAGITLISLAPGILVTLTCFPFVVTVLAILRQALGLQQSPPNMVIVSLALFITYFVMEPVFTLAWDDALGPYSRQELPLADAIPRAFEPFRRFMTGRADPEVLILIGDLRPGTVDPASPPVSVLLPGFLLSELARAFQVGFLLFLPFIIIDMVVAAILMSMGMMMVPPAIVSLPFKLAFFVIANGWGLVAQSLVLSYQ